ncbi:phospholipase D-like domain-containing protein [Hymenobacter puniceus]|uniref:hypothetical protein n=1 Tax=Hymenobacter sp. BT190 TaxID=2763505 RepID=UPI001651141A|nr:hypothetical protein [Hymenobacter sp. BT190]MBC6698072.1 hypothetical protein [Hymenobacter sp. BT190]
MSLFKTSELAKPAVTAAGQLRPAVRRSGVSTALFGISRGRKELLQHFGQLEPGQCYHYATGGKWSAHELLQYVLERTGPARVYITSWTITEAPLRSLRELRNAGVIKELTLLLDHRIKSRCPQAWQLVPSLQARVHLSKCHAKVTVVENDEWAVAIVSSQNYTRNPRIEAGIVSLDRGAADFHRSWIERELAGDKPFEQ